METVNIEIIGKTNIYFGLGVEIITALILGGMVGYDREKKHKSAGIKTNVLICLGATLYTAISQINVQNFNMVTVDPNRVAAQIVSGIGFLGAGAIMHARGNVKGLTTAATIWLVAAIGVTIGFGYPLVASIFTVTLLFVLKILGPVYRFIEKRNLSKLYHFEVLSNGSIIERIRELIRESSDIIHDLHEEVLEEQANKIITYISINTHEHKVDYITNELKKYIRVEQVTSYCHDIEPVNVSLKE